MNDKLEKCESILKDIISNSLPSLLFFGKIKWWKQIYYEFLWDISQLRRAQYGDTNFGDDEREREKRESQLRKRIIATSRAPIHAGFDWERN